MWNHLTIYTELSAQEKNELTKNIEELKADCSNYFAKKKKQVRNLIEFSDGLFVWNPLKEVLCYIVVRNENEVYGFQVGLICELNLQPMDSPG